jgi:hypothetical protein
LKKQKQITFGGAMKKLIFYGLLSSLLWGCVATHLAYVHETSLGIDVAVSTEGTGRLVFGYDRDTYALVPRKSDGTDAMTLTALGCIYAKGLNEVHFDHFVSSGDAAIKIAKSPDTLAKINQAIQGGGNKCEPSK